MAEYDLDGWTAPDLISPDGRQRHHEVAHATLPEPVMSVLEGPTFVARFHEIRPGLRGGCGAICAAAKRSRETTTAAALYPRFGP